MPKQQRAVDHIVDAAREVNHWLEKLGENCCAGRSYREMDNARESLEGDHSAQAESEDQPAPSHRAPSR
jgi:hypothetical protein